MAPRTKLAAAPIVVTAAALLLAACGGGGGDDDTISSGTSVSPSAAATTGTPSPSATGTPAADAPAFDFPADVKVVIDADTTGDAAKDAVLRDQAYGQQAIFLAIAKLDSKLPALSTYLSGEALQNWTDKVAWGKSHHTSVTGTTRFYKRTAKVTGPASASVTFCESERDSYGKDTKTGKAIRTTPSKNDFTQHYALMSKGADGVWKMTTYQSQSGAASCVR
ncbi:hypothetical protein ABZ901_08735 [Actinacidiphila alni]|uniref:hypothetical protein n=1 Tax=Actinacidiphila alni TaxID=380248 RepID=UPI0033F827CC